MTAARSSLYHGSRYSAQQSASFHGLICTTFERALRSAPFDDFLSIWATSNHSLKTNLWCLHVQCRYFTQAFKRIALYQLQKLALASNPSKQVSQHLDKTPHTEHTIYVPVTNINGPINRHYQYHGIDSPCQPSTRPRNFPRPHRQKTGNAHHEDGALLSRFYHYFTRRHTNPYHHERISVPFAKKNIHQRSGNPTLPAPPSNTRQILCRNELGSKSLEHIR